MDGRLAQPFFQVAQRVVQIHQFDQIRRILPDYPQQCPPVFMDLNAKIAGIPTAGPNPVGFIQDLVQKGVAAVPADKKSGDTYGSAEKYLPPFALD